MGRIVRLCGDVELTHGSLFAGVGGFDIGMERAGWETRWQVEWDRHASSVLARHWPKTKRYSDVRDVCGADIEPVACITFGSPCTDLSMAGRRAGLAGEHSGLFHEAIRIIKEMQHATNGRYPRWAIWENVAGAFSSHGGADFRTVLEEMAGLGAHHLEWSLLDARYFGVPQRRRRVFVVACLDPRTAEHCPAPLLPVFDRSERDSAPKPAKGQVVARPARGRSAAGRSGELNAGVGIPDVAVPLGAHHASDDLDRMTFIPAAVSALTATGVGTCGADDNQAQAGHLLAVSVAENQRGEVRLSDVAGSMSGASGKLGQGTPSVIVATSPLLFQESQFGISEYADAGTLRAGRIPDHQMIVEPYTFDGFASAATTSVVDDGVARTLVSKRPLCVATVADGPVLVAETGQGFYSTIDGGSTAGTLTARSHKSMEQYVVDEAAPAYPVARRGRDEGWAMELGEADLYNTLRAGDGGSSRANEIATPQMAVRRLMPIECERLMGWPDDHTRYNSAGTEIADSHRYRMCGNGVASPVAAWIGGHVAAVDLAAGNRRPRPHPAAFSEPLIPVMAQMIREMDAVEGDMLDPFAGIGRGSRIAEECGRSFVGVEIEPEWAMQHPSVVCGDSRRLPFADETFGAVGSSPAYGNRLADQYAGSLTDEAELRAGRKIKRRTYRVFLGRPLSAGSGAAMQWGDDYRELHRQVWSESVRCLKPGGVFVLNIKDHFRRDELQGVVEWHVEVLESLGLRLERRCEVGTRQYTVGSAGSKKRSPELVLGFRKPIVATVQR